MKKALVLAVVLAISVVPGMAQQHRGGADGGQGAPAQGFAWDGFGLSAYLAGFEALLTPEQLAKLRLLRGFAEHPGLGPACRLTGLCR